MPSDKKDCREQTILTANDLQIILEVNKKATELYVEVQTQNDEVLKELEEYKTKLALIDTKIVDIDKSLFRLLVILGTIAGSVGIGTVITIIQLLIAHH